MKALRVIFQVKKIQRHSDHAYWPTSGAYEVNPVVGNLREHQGLSSLLLAGVTGSGSRKAGWARAAELVRHGNHRHKERKTQHKEFRFF